MNTKRKSPNKEAPFLVVVHDAGETEIIAAYLRAKAKKESFVIYAEGPAKKILRRVKLPFSYLPLEHDQLSRIFEKHKEAPFLILGTGKKDLVRSLIVYARLYEIRSIGYLESWSNFRERFGYPKKDWRKNIADEIWVGDRHAEHMAQIYFKDTSIRFISNQYFKDIITRFNVLKKDSSPREILFLSDGVSGVGEILQEFVRELVRLKVSSVIRIRFHPKDNPARYDGLIKKKKHSFTIKKSHEKDIVKDLLRASVVVGTETVAMVPAVLVKKHTISIAMKGIKRQLPYKQIVLAKNGKHAAQLLLRVV